MKLNVNLLQLSWTDSLDFKKVKERFACMSASQLVQFCHFIRSEKNTPLGIISQRHCRDERVVLCSRLDLCLDALRNRFPTKPFITNLKSFNHKRFIPATVIQVACLIYQYTLYIYMFHSGFATMCFHVWFCKCLWCMLLGFTSWQQPEYTSMFWHHRWCGC